MEFIEWNESYSVGNGLMDAHHRVFFEMIKEFRELANKDDLDVIKERIDFLVEYAAMHMVAEERLMQLSNYHELDAHKAEHAAFTQEMLSISESFNKDPSSVSADKIMAIMENWLVNHIMGTDKRYVPYIQKLHS